MITLKNVLNILKENKLTYESFKKLKDGDILPDGRMVLIEHDAGEILRSEKIIKEQSEKNSTFFDLKEPILFESILQRGDVENRNGRIYPLDMLRKLMEKYQEMIDMNISLGEVDHPESQQVSLKNTSHLIKSFWWDKNELKGTIQLLTTPGFIKNGICSTPADELANFARHGVRLGISSRGLGSLKTVNGKNYVQDDFQLVCFDIVASPSTHGAFLYPVTEEKSNITTENIVPNSEKNRILKENVEIFLKNYSIK